MGVIVDATMGDIKLTESQQNALNKIRAFLKDNTVKVFILKGFAGTGKTTMVKAVLADLIKKGDSFILLASTGRAAKVLSDATQIQFLDESGTLRNTYYPAKTIHSQIYSFSEISQDLELFEKSEFAQEITSEKSVKLRFTLSHHENGASNTVYIIDEASMISDTKESSLSQAEYGSEGRLLKDLFEYDNNGKYIFVGDMCQLPPVNQSFSPSLCKTYIESTFRYATSEVELTEVVRQASDNDIALSASRIRKLYLSSNKNKIASFPFRGYKHIHIVENQIEMLNMYIKSIKNRDYSKSTMIVMSNRMVATLSNIIRPAIGFNETRLSIDDLLLVTQNNMISGLMNGDLVKVTQIGNREKRAGLTFVYVEVESLSSHKLYGQLMIEDVLYCGGTNITPEQQTQLFIDYHLRMKSLGVKQNSSQYKEGMFMDHYLNALRCVFGYVLTCHKSQGGEWDNVFLIIPRGLPYNNPRSYAYQWVYTAMTRAKKELYVIEDYWVSN